MTSAGPQAQIERLERLAGWLDDRFRIPGTGLRFGLDALIGLVPGIGDTATAVSAAYLIARAAGLGVPRRILLRMAANAAIDLLVGTIPLLGDLFDIGFKANRRNVALLRRHAGRLRRRAGAEQDARRAG